VHRKPTIRRHPWPLALAFRAALILVGVLATCATVWPASGLDDYGGWTGISGRATGFFNLETLRDRWWFTTPEGNAFLVKAVEVVEPCGGRTSAAVRQQIAGWDFNTIGPRCPDDLRREGMPYTVLLNLSRPTMDAGAAVPGRRFPDVFDPRFERIATEIAGNVCSLHADSKWLLGYFTDDALDWRTDGPEDLVDAFLAMSADAPGKQALVAELKRLYADDVKDFNDAWGLSLGSFDEVLNMSDLKPGARFQGYAVSRDHAALESLIASRYFEVASAAIKAHDPNHLSLGCRFSRPPSREVLAAMAKRMNVVSIVGGPDVTPDVLTQIHSDSGLPVLVCGAGIGEPAADGAPASVARAERDGSAFEKRVESLAEQAFVVGYAWPRYRASNPASASDPPGLVNDQGDPDGPLVDRVARANRRFYSQASYARLKPTLFDVVERYELRRAGPAGITIDGDLRDWASAMPMILRPSTYEKDARDVEASAYLMWDAGAVYVAGRVYDPSVEASTATSYVGPDWIELGVAIYSFRVTLQPGYQTVTDVRKDRTKPARVVIGRILAQPESGGDASRRVVGYTFEGTVPVSGPIPEGFISRFGLALHHYTKDGREVRLSFPYYWWPANPSSAADIIIAGRAPE
jgi:hypothetical protein